jgi:hypothetical protein
MRSLQDVAPKAHRRAILFWLALASGSGLAVAAGSFSALPPVAITSCGQSPDAFTVSLLAKRVKLAHVFENLLKPEALTAKTLVVVPGGSAKGLGEAGIDEKGELQRVDALLARARALKAAVVAVHVGGQSRRGPLSDKFIDPVVAKADYLIVTEDGDADGYFTRVAKARGIPLVRVKQASDVGRELKAIFPGK